MTDTAAPPEPPAEADGPLPPALVRRILIGVVLAMMLGALDQTIVATALPTIGDDLGDLIHLPWVVTAYLLSGTAVTPLYGKLADIIGRRAMILTGVAIFVVSSVLAALAPTMGILIFARFLQGLGGGGLIALGQTVIADIISPRERMRYQAYFAMVFVTASIAGPILGGFFAEQLHWSFIFWINVPLGLLALAVSNTALKQIPRHERPHRIDYVGGVLMVIATVTLLLALSWGGDAYPWLSGEIIGLLVASAVAWALFVVRQLTAAEPFVPLAVMFNPVVAAATAANFFIIGTSVGLTIYIPIYFVAVMHLTASQSGLALIALVGGSVVGAQISGRIMMWTPHYKRSPIVGLTVAVLATCVLAATATTVNLWQMEILLSIIGVGFGTMYPVTTVSVQNAVESHQLGTTTATYNFFRSLGSAFFVAVMGAIFVDRLGVGGQSIGSLDALVAAAARQGTAIAPVFQYIFGASAFTLAVGFLCLALMEERPLRAR